MGHHLILPHSDHVHDHHGVVDIWGRSCKDRTRRDRGRTRQVPLVRTLSDRPAGIPECRANRRKPDAQVQCLADSGLDEPVL